MKIPLAWLQLKREKMRLLVAIAGVAFADILMFMQLGFQEALFESAVSFHRNIQGDIFLISPQSTSLLAMKTFPQRRLYQTLSVAGVESVSPIYIGFGLWKNPDPEKRNTRQLMVVGFNPVDQVFNLPGVSEHQEKIKLPDVVLFDEASRPEFGPIAAYLNAEKRVETEVENRRIKVGGLFKLGASFGADGNIMTSDLNFLRLFPSREKGLIDIGVINLKPGTNTNQVIQEIEGTFIIKQECTEIDRQKKACTDVKVLSYEEFIEFEKNYWETGTAIGFIFTLGTAMGFIVGIVIVYQILYTDVADHLAEYATLKAIGYTDLYLLSVVFQEAIILSVLGYLPGFTFSWILYTLARNATSLPLYMTLFRASLVLMLTLFMCLISGTIAVRKLRSADPADIF